MPNFPFWLQQDLYSIYQFWKQPTSIPYCLFCAVERNSFIHSKFHINFFLTFPTKPKQYFSTNQIARMTNFDQSENDKKFSIFSILLHYLNTILVIFAAFYVIIATHCHFNVVNLSIYHCSLVFLHSSVDS